MSFNPFDPPPLIKTPPRSAPNIGEERKLKPPPGRPVRVPIFDDGERDERKN